MYQNTATPNFIEVDCRGMQCPAPILQISKAWRLHKGEAVVIRVQATDGDFPRDLNAWCRTTKTELLSITDEDGVHVALLGVNGATVQDITTAQLEEAPAQAVGSHLAEAADGVKTVTLDCRGLQCPTPILKISKAWRGLDNQPARMIVDATDADFPRDLEAWCRTTKSTLLDMSTLADGTHRATLGLFGAIPASLEPTQPALHAPFGADAPEAPAAAPAPLQELDLRGQPSALAILRIGQAVLASNGAPVPFVATAGAIESELYAWAAATKAQIGPLKVEDGLVRTTVTLAGLPAQPAAPAPVQAQPAHAPTALTMPSPTLSAMAPVDEVPRENLATLLILHNDLESLLAAMMVANTSKAQGMDVVIFFSFWGVNLLRGEEAIEPESTALSTDRPGWMQKMMKWMMPKGPERQSLAKMNMGGAGSAMMKHLMKQRNVQSLREMMEDAIEQEVTFMMCTMSMGIMGIEKRDIMDLPNLEYGGVTSFVESSRRSALSLVF